MVISFRNYNFSTFMQTEMMTAIENVEEWVDMTPEPDKRIGFTLLCNESFTERVRKLTRL